MVFEKVIGNLLEQDKDGLYRSHFQILACTQLKKYGSIKTSKVDPDVIEALKILVNASLEADFLYENETKKLAAAKKEKKPPVKGFVNKLVLKTLKVAEGMLAIMILKNPIKMGLAYNALHFAIKWLEEDILKKQQKK